MADQQQDNQTGAQNLRLLAAYFAPDDLDWRAITISKRTNKGLAAAYITNRAIMNRLDEAVGPGSWRNEFAPGPGGGIVCGLSIYVESRSEWVTKWDGAENTDVEAIKGGLSNAMRRAAVQWGIGRYLYDFPQQWVPVDDYKQFKISPRIPDHYLPGREAHAQPARPARAERTPAEREEIRQEEAMHAGPVTDTTKRRLCNRAKLSHDCDEWVDLLAEDIVDATGGEESTDTLTEGTALQLVSYFERQLQARAESAGGDA